MKRTLSILFLILCVSLAGYGQKKIARYNRLTNTWASYDEVSIQQIQRVPLDSLLVADTIQNSVPARRTLQTSPYVGDTVVTTGLCVVPGQIITFTARGYTMLLYDTANIAQWRGLLVRVNAPNDTAQINLDGFSNVERGDIIRITGVLSEFPNDMNSVTQFQPIPGIAIEIISSGTIPPPVRLPVSNFYEGIFSGGTVRYSTGEPYESMLVEFTDLVVDARVNNTRRTFSMVDTGGNQITDYDASRFFTGGHTSSGITIAPEDTTWARIYPVSGTQIDTIRGFITTVSGSESPRGYRIAPVFRSDVVIGVTLPSISQHRRNPVVVTSDSIARISARVVQQSGGYPIASVSLLYSVDNGPFTTVPMTFNASDSTYKGEIPQQAEDSFVHYFIKAIDQASNSTNLASSALGGASSDTSKGFFFYTVLNRALTIRDIQYTPFINGRSGYLGAAVSTSGIVTADTAHLSLVPISGSGGTNAWYMQSGNEPWSGIWIAGPESTLAGLRNGDSITVTGSVTENFDVTQIQNISSVTVHSSNNPLPDPVILITGGFGINIGNGTPSAEQYEGMLVRFNNVTVTSIWPTFSDPTEYEVSDGSGAILVRRDGTNSFSNIDADTLLGKTILHENNTLSSLTGIMYYSFNRYKVTPRNNADFGTLTGVEENGTPSAPVEYALGQNYPNPFNPTTTIRYTLPANGFVTLKVYNLLGELVSSPVNGYQDAGEHQFQFNASSLPSGVYFYRLNSEGFQQIRKMVLTK